METYKFNIKYTEFKKQSKTFIIYKICCVFVIKY